MKRALTPTSQPATPGYVLRVLVDAHRQQCQFDPEAQSDVNLTFDTTVAEWRSACDLLAWRRLAHSLNDWWQIERTEEEWRAVLEPARECRLREVCQFIAATASMPLLPASRFLGVTCHSATAFKAIRDALASAGASVAGLRPSSSLDPFLRRYLTVFLSDISRLAPGALPPVKTHAPLLRAATLGLVLFLIVAGLASWLGALPLASICLSLSIVSWAMTWVAARIGPSSVEFGDLKTFRDLAELIARHRNA